MKRELIEVTQADIDQARAARLIEGVSCQNCPVAQALARQHPEADVVGASPDTVRKRVGAELDAALPSRRMVRFMSRWDRHWEASPARFLVVWED